MLKKVLRGKTRHTFSSLKPPCQRSLCHLNAQWLINKWSKSLFTNTFMKLSWLLFHQALSTCLSSFWNLLSYFILTIMRQILVIVRCLFRALWIKLMTLCMPDLLSTTDIHTSHAICTAKMRHKSQGQGYITKKVEEEESPPWRNDLMQHLLCAGLHGVCHS